MNNITRIADLRTCVVCGKRKHFRSMVNIQFRWYCNYLCFDKWPKPKGY